jgi:hypothetical protein
MDIANDLNQPAFSISARTRRSHKVVYTAVFGAYDDISDVSADWDCDFICITDCHTLRARGWTQICIDSFDAEPAILNRYYKILAHRFLSRYKYSLYVDGHVVIKKDPSMLFDKYLTDFAIALPYHPERNCSYDEAQYCVETGLVTKADVEKQFSEYFSDGFQKHSGLTENGIILRDHNNSIIVSLMEAWWREYFLKLKRDQLSLPYLLWKKNIVIGRIEEGPRLSSEYFDLKPHKNRQVGFVRQLVWYIETHRHRNVAYRAAGKLVTFAHCLVTLFKTFLNSRAAPK